MRFVVASGALLVFVAACGGTDQSDICKKYVSCEQAYEKASSTGPVDLSQYAEGGPCWASAANSQECDQECTAGIAQDKDAAADANLDVPACQG
ncbi:MAG TPA: hypothetical protein VGO62_16090 [Myxococcota bacterium]|jgi:hypothetical protein